VSGDIPYSLPRPAPTYGRPPYAYRRCPQLLVVFRSSEASLRALVPEPLTPNSDDLAFLMIGTMRTDEFGDYSESILAVPAGVGEHLGNFVVFHHVDAEKPMVAGREIMGWPKRLGEVTWAEEAGRITGTATRDGVALVRAVAELAGPARPEDLTLSPTWLNLKVIPSVADGAPPDVAEITATTLRDVEVAEARRGTATLELASTAADPVGRLEVHEVVGAVHALLSFDLPGGEVVHDYLTEAVGTRPESTAIAT
jgi:acetoacetate decarboxylase